MVPQCLFSILLLFHPHICQGDETEDWQGPSHLMLNGLENDFVDSVFARKLVGGKWRYQSLTEDNSTGYCGYCDNGAYNQEDTYILKKDNGFSLIRAWNGGVSIRSSSNMRIIPVPGRLRLVSNDSSSPTDYTGLYSVTSLLYNGFPQYEKSAGGPRLYVNIYKDWVLGTSEHADILIMNQAQPTSTSPTEWPGWKATKGSKGESVMILSTGAQPSVSLTQQPECILEDSIFRLSSKGTYNIPGDSDGHYYSRISDGSWAQYLSPKYSDEPYYKTSESSTVIPSLGWGNKWKSYAPKNDLSIAAVPCTITLASKIPVKYTGTYTIAEVLKNGHLQYIKDNTSILYVNRHQEWVFGNLHYDKYQQYADALLLSLDCAGDSCPLPTSPLAWPEWSNSGTNLHPVLTVLHGASVPVTCPTPFKDGSQSACKNEGSLSSIASRATVIFAVTVLIVRNW